MLKVTFIARVISFLVLAVAYSGDALSQAGKTQQKSTTPQAEGPDHTKLGADRRADALQQFIASLPKGERNDIRGFYMGMPKDAASEQVSRLKLRSCSVKLQAQNAFADFSEEQSPFWEFTCKTHSDLEIQKRLNFSEQYLLMFTEGLRPNFLKKVMFHFASGLSPQELISVISEQYGVKPATNSDGVLPMGQLGNLPLGREATFLLKDGSELQFEASSFYGRPFYKLELTSRDLEKKIRAMKEQQDRKLSQPPRF